MRSLIQAIEATDRCILACVQLGDAKAPRLKWGCTLNQDQEWHVFCHYDSASEALLAFAGRPMTLTRFEAGVLSDIERMLRTMVPGSNFCCEWVGSGKTHGWKSPFAAGAMLSIANGPHQEQESGKVVET